MLAEGYRDAGLSVADVVDLLYLFSARWLAEKRHQEIYDFDEFISKNRVVLEPLVEKGMRAFLSEGAR